MTDGAPGSGAAAGRAGTRLLGILLLLGATACQRQPAPISAPTPARPAPRKPLPADFVICVDNSASIKPPEQRLIREIVLLLVDLAELTDRVSVVTFGRSASDVVSTTIATDGDRLALKQRIRTGLDFTERFSDIRAGVRLVAQSGRPGLLREPGTSLPVVIVLSDGKLEPEDGKVLQASDEIERLTSADLAAIPIHAIVLGDTTCRDPIVGPGGRRIDGLTLMKELVARTPSRFSHAVSLDQVMELVFQIVNSAKGGGSAGERGRTAFRIDSTVEWMTLVVRKRSADGKQLVLSEDLRLRWPGAAEGGEARTGPVMTIPDTATQIYWSNDLEYFDLIRVRSPAPGGWSISATNGTLDVLDKIVTPIELRHEVRPHYFLNESATLSAWLHDRKTGAVAKGTFAILAKVAVAGRPGVEIPLEASTDGYHVLEMPGDISKALQRPGSPVTVTVELTAQRVTASGTDPWFVRRSPPLETALAEAFTTWGRPPERFARIPLLGYLVSYFSSLQPRHLTFGSALDRTNPRYPAFDVNPKVTLALSRFDPETGRYSDVATLEDKQPSESAGRLDYSLQTPDLESGIYRYRYAISGVTRDGAFALSSPWFPITIRNGWEWYGIPLLVLLVVSTLSIRTGARCRLSGSIVKTQPVPVVIRQLSNRDEMVTFEGLTFALSAARTAFVHKRVRFRIVRGGPANLGGRLVRSGDEITLPPGTHKMTFGPPGQQHALTLKTDVI